MGTIRKDRNGAWFMDYVDSAGRRRREVVGRGEDARRRARQVLAQREAEAELGIHNVRARETPRFDDVADEWQRRCKSRGLRAKTLEGYDTADRLHLRPTFGGMRLGAIDKRSIETFLADLRDRGTRRGATGTRVPLSAATINKALAVLKMILASAVEDGILAEDPSARVRPVREPDRDDRDTMRVLSPDEIQRLTDAAAVPYRSLYQLAVYSGMRRGELLGLRWSDVDLHEGRVHVRRTRGRVRDGDGYRVVDGPVKTRASRRTIDVPRAVLLALPASDVEGDYVFRGRSGGPLDPDNVDRRFKADLALAGMPEIRFHDLRHTHASLLIAANVKAIQARLGNTAIGTTLNIYGHLLPSAFQGVCDRLDVLLQTGAVRGSNQTAKTNAATAEMR